MQAYVQRLSLINRLILGMIQKNEKKVDEMVSIVSTLHQLCPHEATIRQCSSFWVMEAADMEL